MKTKKQVPYSKFKAEMTKLIEYALKHELRLSHFVKTNGVTTDQVCESQSPCGAPACILGYAPVLFPRRFKYTKSERTWESKTYIEIYSKYGTDEACINAFTGDLYHLENSEELSSIFGANCSTAASDTVVAMGRLKAIQEAKSYGELIHVINVDEHGYF